MVVKIGILRQGKNGMKHNSDGNVCAYENGRKGPEEWRQLQAIINDL